MLLLPNTQATTRTLPHLQLLQLLENLGFEVEEEKSFPPYSVDAYLPSIHVAFEADGPQHMKKRDGKRDAVLMGKYGLPIYRLTSKMLRNKEEDILGEVVKMLLQVAWKKSSVERRTYARDAGWLDE